MRPHSKVFNDWTDWEVINIRNEIIQVYKERNFNIFCITVINKNETEDEDDNFALLFQQSGLSFSMLQAIPGNNFLIHGKENVELILKTLQETIERDYYRAQVLAHRIIDSMTIEQIKIAKQIF